MKGYIVSFDTLGRRFNDTRDDLDQYVEYSATKEGSKFRGKLAYGAFDRIMIEPVNVFSRYSNIPNSMTTWVGRHHSVFLYEVDSELRVEPVNHKDEQERTTFGFLVKDSSEESDYAYAAISLFSLSNEYSSRITNFDMALKQLRLLLLRKIDEIVEEYRALHGECDIKIQYEVYGCFNTSEIAVLWVAEQYCDILQIIDQIKYLKINFHNIGDSIPLFFNVYSIFSRNQLNTICNEKIKQNGKGVALLQMVVNNESAFPEQPNKNLKEILQKYLKNALGADYQKCKIMCGVGEYDVTIRMPSKYTYNLFLAGKRNKDAMFNRENDFFNRVIKTRVYLAYTSEECNVELAEILRKYTGEKLVLEDEYISRYMGERNIENEVYLQQELAKSDNNGGDKDNQTLYDIYQELRENVKAICPKTVGAVDTLDGLFTDYLSNIQACYNVLWRDDFHYQFKKTIEYLLLFARGYRDKKNVIKSKEFWAIYSEMINNLHQQIVHISQANRMFLRIPASNLLYTGSYDFLLHAYYGIIKEILGYAYSLESDLQAKIVPLIAVNIAPHVESRSYTLGKDWLSVEDENRRDAYDIMRLYIPYTLLTEPERGYYYIIHELFHYIAPPDRKQRNEIVNELIIKEMIAVGFCDFLCEKVMEKVLDKDYLSVDAKHRFYEAMQVTCISTGDSNEKVYHISDDDIKSIRDGVAGVMEQIKIVIRPVVCKIEEQEDALLSKVQASVLEEQRFEEKRGFLYNHALVKNKFRKVSREEWEKERKKIHIEICTNRNVQDAINSILNTGNDTEQDDLDKILLDVVGQILHEEILVSQVGEDFYTDTYNELGNDLQDIIINGIREAVPDLCMCRIGLMNPVDYVMHFVRNQIDLMKDALDEQVFMDYDILRVFAVVDYLVFKISGQADKDVYLMKNQEYDPERDFLILYINGDLFANQFVSLFLAEHASADQMKTKQLKITKNKAEEWLARVRTAAVGYLQCYDCYRDKLLELFECYDPCKRETTRKMGFASLIAMCEQKKKQFGESVRMEENENVREAQYKKFQGEYFDSVLAVAKHYIVQPTFLEVEHSCDDVKDKPNRRDNLETAETLEKSIDFGFRGDLDWEKRLSRIVYTQTEFFRVVEKYVDRLNEGLEQCDRVLWYRGQENRDYVLVPGLLREFNENRKTKYHNLGQMQRRNFEAFKVRLEGSPEMTNSARYALADYIAFMQHYEKPTSFLDWSDNMLIALYFALEPLIDLSKNKEKCQYASLYLFSPYKYNQARHYMLTSVSALVDSSGDRTQDFQKLRDHITSDLHVIPNLTVSYNERVYDAYLLNTGKLKNKEMNDETSVSDIHDIARVMPVAITTSRINPRINRQEGNFVAFHLDTFRDPAVKEEKDVKCTKAFDYISLENIQRIFLKKYQKQYQLREEELLKHAFLFKVDIAIDTLGQQLAKLLEVMGIQKGTIYPEPNNWRI